jgi:hypothetical protein
MPRASRHFLPGYVWHITHLLCSSQFQAFQSFNRFAPFKSFRRMTPLMKVVRHSAVQLGGGGIPSLKTERKT